MSFYLYGHVPNHQHVCNDHLQLGMYSSVQSLKQSTWAAFVCNPFLWRPCGSYLHQHWMWSEMECCCKFGHLKAYHVLTMQYSLAPLIIQYSKLREHHHLLPHTQEGTIIMQTVATTAQMTVLLLSAPSLTFLYLNKKPLNSSKRWLCQRLYNHLSH